MALSRERKGVSSLRRHCSSVWTPSGETWGLVQIREFLLVKEFSSPVLQTGLGPGLQLLSRGGTQGFGCARCCVGRAVQDVEGPGAHRWALLCRRDLGWGPPPVGQHRRAPGGPSGLRHPVFPALSQTLSQQEANATQWPFPDALPFSTWRLRVTVTRCFSSLGGMFPAPNTTVNYSAGCEVSFLI